MSKHFANYKFIYKLKISTLHFCCSGTYIIKTHTPLRKHTMEMYFGRTPWRRWWYDETDYRTIVLQDLAKNSIFLKGLKKSPAATNRRQVSTKGHGHQFNTNRSPQFEM